MSSWYYLDDGQQQGPVEDGEFQNLISSGKIGPDDLIWNESMADWQPAGQVEGIQWPASSTPTPAPPPKPAPAPAPASRPQSFTQPTASLASAARPTAPPEQITNYLPWAIVATIFCCLWTGIPAIIYAAKANSAQTAGDYATAKQAANSAKTWLIVSVVGGLIAGVVYIIINAAALQSM